MAEIAPELVDLMMVKCGRRCCICRRFKPTLLQCHHIQLQSQGGSDDEENLIVLCLTCHTDVHSKVPFTRRFSHAELRGHRDALVAMVASGNFPTDEANEFNHIVVESTSSQPQEDGLSVAATEILLLAVNAEGNREGIVVVSSSLSGTMIYPGNHESMYQSGDRRAEAKYKAAIQELEQNGLLEYTSDAMREVTHKGYLIADELSARLAKPVE